MILEHENFTIDDLRMRGLQPVRAPLPRSSFRIVSSKIANKTSDHIWLELICAPARSRENIKKAIELKDNLIKVCTGVPAPGAVVKEITTLSGGMYSESEIYTYLDIIELNSTEVRCAKMNMNDSKVYEDRFHLLSAFTSLYSAACLDKNGKASISSSNGIYGELQVYR